MTDVPPVSIFEESQVTVEVEGEGGVEKHEGSNTTEHDVNTMRRFFWGDLMRESGLGRTSSWKQWSPVHIQIFDS